MLALTPAMLLFCISEKFYTAAEDERARYTQEMESLQEERMAHHKALFQARVHDLQEEKQITDRLTATGVQHALKVVHAARKTGRL